MKRNAIRYLLIVVCIIAWFKTGANGEDSQDSQCGDDEHTATTATTGKIRVLVTGANGFIGSSIVKELLERGGYQVRGTVRDPNDDLKTRALRSFPNSASNLELVKLDLASNENVFQEVVKDIDWIMHAAAKVDISPKVEDEDYQIEVAVNSTLHLLRASQESPSVKRFILTSSVASIMYGYDRDRTLSSNFTEDDWSKVDDPSIKPYAKIKFRSEQAAWKYMHEQQKQDGGQKPTRTFTLSSINPTFVFGPVPSGDVGSSTRVLQRIMEATDPLLPNVYMAFVDIRDVVEAHIRAALLPEAAGKRFILNQSDGGEVFMLDIVHFLKEHFGPLGYHKVGAWKLPKWIAWLVSFVDAEIASVYNLIDEPIRYDNTQSRAVLGMEYIPANQTLIDAVNSMVEHGLIAKPDGTYHRLEHQQEQQEKTAEL